MKVIKYLALAILALTFFSSCVGNHLGYVTVSEDIVFTVDKKLLQEGDVATFRVQYKGTPVLSDTYTLTVVTNGVSSEILDNKFIGNEVGKHEFSVSYINEEGEEFLSDVIEVEVRTPAPGAALLKGNTILYVTGLWCTNCPEAAKLIKEASYQNPREIHTVAIHYNDILTSQGRVHEKPFDDYLNTLAWPTVNANFVKSTTITTITESVLGGILDQQFAIPAKTGILINTTLEGSTLNADVEVNFVEAGNYRLLVLLIEDEKIVKNNAQIGSPLKDMYIHQNILRSTLSQEGAIGDVIGQVGAGTGFSKSYTLEIDPKYTAENCRVLAVVLEDNGNGEYYSTNANTVPVGYNTPVQYVLE